MQGLKSGEIPRTTLLAAGRGPRGIGVRTTDRITPRYLRDLGARIDRALEDAKRLHAEVKAVCKK